MSPVEMRRAVLQVKPKLALLKRTLLGTGGALAACAIVLIGLARSGSNTESVMGIPSF